MFKKIIFVALCCYSAIGFAQDQFAPTMQNNGSYFVDEFGNLTELKSAMFSFEQTEHDFGNLPEGPRAGYTLK